MVSEKRQRKKRVKGLNWSVHNRTQKLIKEGEIKVIDAEITEFKAKYGKEWVKAYQDHVFKLARSIGKKENK